MPVALQLLREWDPSCRGFILISNWNQRDSLIRPGSAVVMVQMTNFLSRTIKNSSVWIQLKSLTAAEKRRYQRKRTSNTYLDEER